MFYHLFHDLMPEAHFCDLDASVQLKLEDRGGGHLNHNYKCVIKLECDVR